MFSSYNTSIKGLIFTILFYCTFPFVYMLLLGMLMYGDENVVKAMATFALSLLAMFLFITALAFVIFIRQLKKRRSYSSLGTFIFFTLLLLVSYPLMIFSPFVNLHVLGLKGSYSDALVMNIWFGCIFLILGVSLDVVKYRINKKNM